MSDTDKAGINFVGAFWVGILFIVPGILGVISTDKNTLISGLVLGFVFLLIAIAGAGVDGAAYNTVSNFQACGLASNTTTKAYGNPDYYFGNI